jgi:hypothetical protein
LPPNSPANPLPTAPNGPKIPLPAGPLKSHQVTDLSRILDVERAHFGADKRFFPCRQGKDATVSQPLMRRPDRMLETRQPTCGMAATITWLGPTAQIGEFASASALDDEARYNDLFGRGPSRSISARAIIAHLFRRFGISTLFRRPTRRAECRVLPAQRGKRGRSTEDIRMTRALASEIE